MVSYVLVLWQGQDIRLAEMFPVGSRHQVLGVGKGGASGAAFVGDVPSHVVGVKVGMDHNIHGVWADANALELVK